MYQTSSTCVAALCSFQQFLKQKLGKFFEGSCAQCDQHLPFELQRELEHKDFFSEFQLLLCYPHMSIGKVWIGYIGYCLFFVHVFVRLWISAPRMKLAASNFARQFIGVQGKKSSIFVNFALLEAQYHYIRRIAQ